jgi:hypothetical protein
MTKDRLGLPFKQKTLLPSVRLVLEILTEDNKDSSKHWASDLTTLW